MNPRYQHLVHHVMLVHVFFPLHPFLMTCSHLIERFSKKDQSR